MAHDDFLRAPSKPPPKKKSFRPENGIRGIAIQLPDGTCGLLNFDTGEVDVWIVGERPAPGRVSGSRRRGIDWALTQRADQMKMGNRSGAYGCLGWNKIGLSTR